MIESRHNRRKTVRACARAVIVRQPPLPRVLFILLAVVALMIQILVVQTHIHIPQTAGRLQTVSITTLAQALVSGAAVQIADSRRVG